MTRKVLFIAAFALLYTAAAACSMVLAMGAALTGLEPGEPKASTATIQLFDLLTQGMMFPLIPLFGSHGAPAWWGYHLLIFGNGVLWGVVLVVLWRAVTRRRLTRPAGPPAA